MIAPTTLNPLEIRRKLGRGNWSTPERFHAGIGVGLMTLPSISVSQSQYRITASIPGRVLAGAIRNQFGWWLPTSAKGEPLTWTSHDFPWEAEAAVYGLAARRLSGN